MRFVTLRNGARVPALGLGTWVMGERRGSRSAEIKALQLGIDLGMTLIDTAEMYGEGGAEEVVGEAIAGRRDTVFVVSKVYPHNASRDGAVAACERSLRRLRIDTLDLYLLHWRGSIPLAETVEAFEKLKADGKIRAWGVSNFDPADMTELSMVAPEGACVANQVLYHLGSRGIEWDLLPETGAQGIAVMAYSPLGQGRILSDPVLKAMAANRGIAAATLALGWVLRHDNVIAIPKAAKLDHVRANAAAADLTLDAAELAALDEAFPPPGRATPLEMI
ncbi:MAG: aldo/keto reductase [Hyphomicrobiaceae bacterium]|nr:aldo/keto reductase [Hyphomicrobiaceae bacterium]